MPYLHRLSFCAESCATIAANKAILGNALDAQGMCVRIIGMRGLGCAGFPSAGNE